MKFISLVSSMIVGFSFDNSEKKFHHPFGKILLLFRSRRYVCNIMITDKKKIWLFHKTFVILL